VTRFTTLFALVLALMAAPAQAEDADLQQTLSDLTSQTADKEKMDTLGATRVELSQTRGWLDAATNAIKEEAEEKCRRFFDLVRAQLKLLDELIALSKLEEEANQLDQAIAAAEQNFQAARSQLEEKQAQIRAMKMKGR
jgi:chromosome segregation ATPase